MTYFHGYSEEEQTRLDGQSSYFEKSLVLDGLHYSKGERILDIGCGTGSNLSILQKAFPNCFFNGVDISKDQIQVARKRFPKFNFEIAPAQKLPWEENTFDHIFIMWLLEHVSDPLKVLSEAFRVCRPGGTITLTETDHTAFQLSPKSPQWVLLNESVVRFFNDNGQGDIGRQLANYLKKTKFEKPKNNVKAFHFSYGENRLELDRHANYVADYLEISLEKLATHYDIKMSELFTGLTHLRNLSRHSNGCLTQMMYRCSAIKPIS